MRWLRSAAFASLITLILSGCGGCSSDPAAGDSCDLDDPSSCENEEVALVCALDAEDEARCFYPPGAFCRTDDDPDLCAPGAICEDAGDPDDEDAGQCRLDRFAECNPDNDICADGLVCDEREDGEFRCFREVIVQGVVFDVESLDAIEGAHVLAFDSERAALSDVAVTDGEGMYSLNIPAVRDEEGEPVQQFFTLRSSAQDYQTFPGGIREAQPIDASQVSSVDQEWIIDTTQTDIGLIALPGDQQGFPQISGRVDVDGGLGGVLVVAEPDGVDPEAADEPVGFGAVSGLDGSFTIFNVPPGDYDVRGYIADVQIEPEEITMAEEPVDNVILVASEAGIADVTGNIQIVRTSGETSVLLMVASTFDPLSARGEAPAGLRAPRTGPGNIDGDWTIEGVPAGHYVAVAAFENDGLVRSLDQGIAGTDLVYFEVPAEGGLITLGESFKVTHALETFGPGVDGPEGLTERPTLRWGRISNADWYEVIVFDALGNIVFEEDDIIHSGGQTEYTAEYDGPFEPGMYYQFRATAFRMDSPVTSTEFLWGVFYAQ